MSDLKVELNLTVRCAKCESLLEVTFLEGKTFAGVTYLTEIEPCKNCLSDEYEKGRVVGIREASHELPGN